MKSNKRITCKLVDCSDGVRGTFDYSTPSEEEKCMQQPNVAHMPLDSLTVRLRIELASQRNADTFGQTQSRASPSRSDYSIERKCTSDE